MMRRAGTSSELTAKLISKSYWSANCLEGQSSLGLDPGATRPRSGAFLPQDEACRTESGHKKGVTGRYGHSTKV
jgi:hypothetical protein